MISWDEQSLQNFMSVIIECLDDHVNSCLMCARVSMKLHPDVLKSIRSMLSCLSDLNDEEEEEEEDWGKNVRARM